MELKDLAPHPDNPRRISDEKLKMLEKSMRAFGDLSGFVFNRRTKRLVGGHQRKKVMPPEAVVKVHDRHDQPTESGTVATGIVLFNGDSFHYREVDWDEPTEKAANIAANKHGGEWDIPKLADWINDLDALNIDLDLTGFDRGELERLMAPMKGEEAEGQDDVPSLPKVAKTQKGDIYQLGNHRLMCGDSTSVTDVEKLMNNQKADLVFTDPPWNVNYGETNQSGRKIMNDHMDAENWLVFAQAIANSALIATRPGAPIYLVMSAQEWPVIDVSLRGAGFHWSSTIIWKKDALVLSRKDYHTQYEPIWYGWNGQAARLVEVADRKQSDIWEFDRPRRSDLHPTTKPVELVERALSNSSYKHSNVLDLFGGSGSTLIAAEKLGRKGFMMELDPLYCDVIVNRWEKFTGQKAELQHG